MGLFSFMCVAHAQPTVPSAAITISGDPVQPAGAPTIVRLTILNTGHMPISYWCSGPGEYPDAQEYIATVVGPAGSSQRLVLSNGQHPAGDGRAMDVAPGKSIQFPATLGILAPGAYCLSVDCAEQAWGGSGRGAIVTWPATHSTKDYQFEVRPDNELAAAGDAMIVARVRVNDPFARMISATWRRRAVRAALVEDLTGDDIVAADRAADGLWGEADPAKVDGPLVASVILKHIKPPSDECDVGLMTRLTRGTQPLDSEPVKAAMAKLVLARPEGMVRGAAAAALDRPAEKVVTTNLFRLPDANHDLDPADVAQRRLHDAAMLAAMLELARSEDVHERKLAYAALADFPSSQAAVDALRIGQGDLDRECQLIAQHSMNAILRQMATTRP
jgi:hypothetical protein